MSERLDTVLDDLGMYRIQANGSLWDLFKGEHHIGRGSETDIWAWLAETGQFTERADGT